MKKFMTPYFLSGLLSAAFMSCSDSQNGINPTSAMRYADKSQIVIEDDQFNPSNSDSDATGKKPGSKPDEQIPPEVEERNGPVEKTSFTELLKESKLDSPFEKSLFSRLTKQEYRYVVSDLLEGKSTLISSANSIIDELPENNYEGSYKNRTDFFGATNLDSAFLKLGTFLGENYLNTTAFGEICKNPGNCFDAVVSKLIPKIWGMKIDSTMSSNLKKYYETFAAEERDKFLMIRIFSSPYFHNKKYDLEEDWKFNAYQIGSAISFTISGSLPDDELMLDMESGDIIHPNVIRKHAKRLLEKYPQRFSKLFVSQWIGYAPLLEVSGNDKYKDVSLSSIMEEPNLIFSSLMQDDSNIASFLDLKYNVVNKNTAPLYGQSVADDSWVKSKINKSLFGTAYMSYKFTDHQTDYPNPILRGSYIVNNLLCDEVQFPTADQLKEVDKVLKEVDPKLSPPDRMAFFRSKPACKSCHEQFDHHGLALEEIGAFGQKRTEYYTGDKIEVGGTLEGFDFNSSYDFIEKIAKHGDFKACFVGHAYNYFTGSQFRGVKRQLLKQPDLSLLDDMSVMQMVEELVVYAFGGKHL